MKKRIFSLLLAILMVTSMIPANTFAEGNGETIPNTTGSSIETTGSSTETTGSSTETTGASTETTGSSTETTGAAAETTVPETTAPVVTICENCGTSPCTCTVTTDICLIGYLNQEGDISFFNNMAEEKSLAVSKCPKFLILTQKIVEKELVEDAEGNTQLVETVIYKTDSTNDDFYFNVIASAPFTEAESFSAVVPAAGLYTTLGSNSVTLYKDLSNATDTATTTLTGEYVVADFIYDATLFNWFVKLTPGENWPAEAEGYVWTYASSMATLTQKPTQQPQNKCPICGEADCTKIHFWCDRCEAYDCGKAHLRCLACGEVDCTKTHTFCGYCNGYDCGIDHSDVNKPVSKPVIPANPTLTPGADVSVVDEDGNSLADGLFLIAGTKTSISAWPNAGGDASYQWQICVDGQWINIQGQTDKGLLISPAMVLSAMDGGKAQVRCAITVAGETKTSDPIDVTVGDRPVMAAFKLASAKGASDAMTTAEGNEDNKVNVIINYVFTDHSIAANPWVASLPKGEAYTTGTPITVPTIPGYAPTIGEGDNASNATLNGYALTLNFSKEDLANDCTVNIVYQPAPVKVVVNHHWQNVDDDNYTLHETEQTTAVTGTKLGDVHNTYEGFYNLLYEHPTVAADGSTVVDVYYDRYYYLMKFDLAGGYSVDPIYARYETEIEVGNPIQAGYEFKGWTDAAGDTVTIPDTMPAENITYYADWNPVDTEYTVAYWIHNDDGTRTYVGSKIVGALSGATVSGSDDLSVETNVCGLPEHDHSSCSKTCPLSEHTHGDGHCIYDCGKTFHDHSFGCVYNCGEEGHTTHTRECYNFTSANVSKTSSNINLEGEDPYYTNNGFNIYWSFNWNNRTEEHYVQIDSSYYLINDYGWNTSLEYTLICHVHTDDCCSVEYHDHSGCTCIVTPHIHQASCYSCGAIAHAHTNACKSDLANYVDYINELTQKNVTVKGDGSTVVDVYYEYRTYTIRFIYAKANATGSGFQIARYTRNGALNDSINGCDWTSVDGSLPTFIDPSGKTERSQVTIDGNTYYYISLKAKLGENIADKWPAANIGPVGNYKWGSWAAAPGTGYRETYGDDHANIVGPYPIMSADMIVGNKDEQKLLDDGTYLAQNMPAWWGHNYNSNIAPHAYHNYFELLPSEDKTNAVEYNGKYYKLVETYTFTAAHNGDTRVDPIYFNGFKCVNDTNDGSGKDKQSNSSNFANNGSCEICGDDCNYCNTFYYDRNMHKLYFWNYNGPLMQGGAGSDVPFGASLVQHGEYVTAAFMKDYYPDGLEPDAYEFAGWYTTAECHDGTEMNWNSTMPDADMTVYAKWVPIPRTVRFFLDEADMEAGIMIPDRMEAHYDENAGGSPDSYIKFEPKIVANKSFLESVDTPGTSVGYDHPYDGYTFVGWFYVEDGEEKAFDPANMPVVQDMDLYGKWSVNVLCPYEIRFILDENGNGVLDEGEATLVADPITGSTLAGNSRTFNAKGDTALYADYQSGFFPNVASHTIDFKASDEGGVVYTFLYKQGDPVPYTVYYVAETLKESGTSLGTIEFDGKSYHIIAETKADDNNVKAVVTENFKPITGYMPDAFQKTLVVVPGSDKNVIIFYYTVDEAHAPYQVNHYVQTLDGKGWIEYRSASFTGEINKPYSADAITITGFTFSTELTQKYNITDNINAYTNTQLPGPVSFDGVDTVSGTLTGNGMQLNLYYTRNLHQYKVQYLEYGTNEVLADEVLKTVPYGTLAIESAITIEKDLDGDGKFEDFQLYEATDPTQSATITDDSKVFTFYYVRCTQNLTVSKTLTGEGADMELPFNFTLTSTAEDFDNQANGIYRYEIKSGETSVESGYKSVTGDTITFALKAGQTITFFDLPTAKYTVTEQDLPLGYYCTEPERTVTLTKNEKQSITVANEYAPASLAIRKVVDHVEEVADNVTEFTFYITVPTGVNGSHSYTVDGEARSAAVESNGRMTITLKENETALFSNLPLGQYTVTEQDYTSEGYSATYVDTDGTTTDGIVTLDKGDAHTVTCTNAYPVGSLTIEKTVQKAYANDEWTGDTFKFTIIRSDGVLNSASYPVYSGTTKIDDAEVQDGELVVDIDFTELGTKTIKIDNLPKGDYTVEEEADEDYTQSEKRIETTISPEDYAGKAEFTNTYKKHLGDLTITKTVNALDGFTAPENAAFTFTVSGAALTKDNYQVYIEGTSASCRVVDGSLTLQLKHGQTATVKDLDLDAYAVTETVTEGFVLTSSNGTTGTISADDSAKAEFTNTYAPRGDLKLTKFVEKEFEADIVPENQSFKFTVTIPEEVDKSRTSYTYQKYHIGTKLEDASDDIEVGGSDTLQVSADNKLSFELQDGQYIVISDLPAGAVTVTEAYEEAGNPFKAPKFDITMESAQISTKNLFEGTIVEDQTTELVCVNTYKRTTGTLEITKTLIEAIGQSDRTEFEFAVELTPSSDLEEVTVTYWQDNVQDTSKTVTIPVTNGTFVLMLEAGWTARMENLPASRYTVTEKSYNNIAIGWGEGGNTGVLRAGETATVVCTNTYTANTGNLMISKTVVKEYQDDILSDDEFTIKVSFRVGETPVEGMFEYKVFNDDPESNDAIRSGAISSGGNLTLKNGQYAIIYDVPPCSFDVTETAATSGLANYDVSYIHSEGHQIQVGKTVTSEITNTYLRRKLTITKELTDMGENDGQKFLFYILDGEGKQVMSVTLGAGESKTVSNLPRGEYTVVEDRSWSWRYDLTKINDQKVTDGTDRVTVDLAASPTASVTFTNTFKEDGDKWLNFFVEMLNTFFAPSNND